MSKRQRTPPKAVPGSSREALELISRIHARVAAFSSSAERLEVALKRGAASHSTLETLRAVRHSAEPLADIADELQALERSWKDQVERELLEFEDRLRRECQTRRWRVDGQWPAFYVERAIAVLVDEKQRTVTVSEDKLEQPTVESVIGRLEPMVADLLPRGFAARAFMASLAKAYDRVRAGSSQVPLLSVYRQLVCDQQRPKFWRSARADAFLGMSIEQFRARLSGALEQGVTAASDRRELRMLPPIDPAEAIFLYQPAEARFGFVGRIEFMIADRRGDGARA